MFSRSRSKGQGAYNKHGSEYYKNHQGEKGGLMGWILSLIMGSRNHSRGYSRKDNYNNSGHDNHDNKEREYDEHNRNRGSGNGGGYRNKRHGSWS